MYLSLCEDSVATVYTQGLASRVVRQVLRQLLKHSLQSSPDRLTISCVIMYSDQYMTC